MAAVKCQEDFGPVPDVEAEKSFVRRRSAKFARVGAYVGAAIAKAVVARIIHNSSKDDLDVPFLFDSSYRNAGKFDVDGDIPVQHVIFA